MIAGLLVMDPSLTIMIVTKENVAAHAFVKHFLRLGLPESINCLVGRLVGYVEMKKGPANQTAQPNMLGKVVLRYLDGMDDQPGPGYSQSNHGRQECLLRRGHCHPAIIVSRSWVSLP